MSTLSQFTGGGATTSIVNFHSSGGTSATNVNATSTAGHREVLSGALTAATLSTLLSVTGAGRCPQLSAYAKDTTARTIRLVVEVDGVTAFDATSASVSARNSGIYAAAGGTNPLSPGEPIVFTSSLVVKVASSLTETDKVAIAYSLYRN
jgi:hypothetical protein